MLIVLSRINKLSTLDGSMTNRSNQVSSAVPVAPFYVSEFFQPSLKSITGIVVVITSSCVLVALCVINFKWHSNFHFVKVQPVEFPNFQDSLPGADVLGPLQLMQWYVPTDPNWKTTEPELKTHHKLVLFWTDADGPLFERGSELFRGCPESRCSSTTSRKFFNQSAGVVFVAHHIFNMEAPPPVRHYTDQVFIFLTGESPHTTPIGKNSWFQTQRFINWTMTYRLDSDIKSHYTYKVPLETETRNFAREKTKLVAWIVSHCHTLSHREDYVKELQKYIPVDIYGRCGNLTCHRNGSCLEKLRDYKFYLAFENTICRDYITEKFTNAFQHETVPIAIGDGNYGIFPTHSFIHAYNFSSPEKLSEYLLMLHKNDTAYNGYMQWRLNPKMTQSYGDFTASKNGFCRLCQMLHGKHALPKSYFSVASWWQVKGHCRNGLWLLQNATSVI